MSDEQPKAPELEGKRKASEVLLSVEDKLITLTKIISVYDMNMKLLLHRVNSVYSYIEQLKSEVAQQMPSPDDTAIVSPVENPIFVDENPIGQRRVSRVDVAPQVTPAKGTFYESGAETLDRAMESARNNRPKTETSAKEQHFDQSKKVPVTQRITDNFGKDLFMAEVTILNDQKELVLKTKTNANGKWQAYVKPGKYIVNVVKTDTSTKNKIEAMQDITVISSNEAITLPTAIIKKP